MRTMWNVFLILTTLSSLAFAEEFEVIRDSKSNFPICVQNQDKSAGYAFAWPSKRDYYQQTVKYVDLATLRSKIESPGLNCYNLTGLRDTVNYYATKSIPNGSSFVGENIPDEVLAELQQVEQGGGKLREYKTASEFLDKNPSFEFTLEANKELTDKWGTSFVSEIYKEWLLRKPKNREIRDELVKRIEMFKDVDPVAVVKGRLKGYTIVFGRGYMQQELRDRAAFIYEAFRLLGVNYKIVEHPPMGTTKENVKLMVPQIYEMLKAGQNLILSGPSKAVPELLLALNEIQKLPPTPGRVVCVVNMVGMLGGSFVVDTITKLGNFFVKNILKKVAKEDQVEFNPDSIDDLKGGKHAFLSTNLNLLPKDILYFNMVGVLTIDHGIPRDKDLATLQMKFTRTQGFPHGSNDGLVEYPGTALPHNDDTLKIYDIILDSSHYGFDGYYEGNDLANPAGRLVFLSAFVDVLASMLP